MLVTGHGSAGRLDFIAASVLSDATEPPTPKDGAPAEQWSKAELVRALNATDAMLDTAQVYGGVVVLRKTPFAVQFLREWLQVG